MVAVREAMAEVTAGGCALQHKPAARAGGGEDARLCLLQAGRGSSRGKFSTRAIVDTIIIAL